MKKNLLLKRILSAVLTIVLLASAIPVSLAVQELFTEELPAQIVREVPELREESVKHFLCDDGSYIAATYAEPVHYNENGVWKEIDNRLILNSNKLSASGEPTYTTRAGLAVSIPQNFADGQKITAENKGYEISFGIKADQAGVAIDRGASVVAVDELMSNAGAQVSAAPQSVSSVVADAELTADVIEERNAELMVVENQAGAVQYRNILPSTNLEYAVTSSSVKESIVVREPQSEYKYYFDMDLDGLTPVENNDGSISLTESGDTASEIFWIEAPYMYDANSDESFAVTMSLTEVEGKYVLAVEADKDWINAADRAFPVVIDPTLHLSGTNIDDAFVISGLQMNSLRRGKELRVGRNLTNLTRTYMKIKMPVNISAQSVIQEATLKLKKASYFQALGQSDVNINAYLFCRGKISWDFDTLEWGNQPYGYANNIFRWYDDDLLDSVPANKQTETYSFNILNAVKRWIATGDNRGIALVSSEETSKVQVDLHSSRVSTSSDRPSLTIKYLPPGIGRYSLMLDQTAQTSQSIEVACNGAWTATKDSSWITVSPSSGSGLSSIRITVRKNRSIDPRTGHVTVKTGSTLLGVLRVTQAGSKLMFDTNAVTAYYKETNAVINVSSTEDWTVETPNWIVATPSSGSGNTAVTVRLLENEGNGIRDGRIRFSTASDSEEVAVTQLDRVSSCFNNIDSYGNVTAVTASDYNHRLATWAMELSYAAYNYPNGEELPIIPGAFMGDFTQTAGMLLEDNGFVNISEYNYTSDSRAAHTIGWRPINVDVSETSQIINDAGGMDNVYQYNIDDKGSVLYNLLDSVCVCDYDQGRNYFRDDTVVIEENTALNTSQDDEVGTKPLVVVDVRGSVTISDWINDVMTQFDSENNRFAAFADEIFTNVENYLSSTGVQNPIILVTGHSMGAAIANILAARLNGIMDPGNVYAYTFATPRTVNEAVSGNQAVNYPNIFNILNSNDVVTYVPSSFFSIDEHWRRHGIDLYINMPYSESRETDILGMPCHSMSVYLNWLNSSEDLSLQEMLTLSEEARVRGLLPIIAKIKCPVGVTIKDSNGNIIGYESQQENAVYPDMLDNGVMSWIEEDGAKMFFIPSIADAASIEIEAYDYGSMNFTVGSVDASTESEIKTLNNISLYPGKEFTADISEDAPVEDTQLFITENGETVGEVTETNPHLKGVEVWHEVKTDNVVTRHSFIVDDTVTEIRLRDEQGGTYFLKPNSSWVTIVEDGDNFRWTGGMSYIKAGDFVYDVLVNSNGEWYTYENALYVHVPQEYADMNKEFLSPKSTTTNTATVPAAVPYYTVIDPTDN
jgi:hypothetical protein